MMEFSTEHKVLMTVNLPPGISGDCYDKTLTLIATSPHSVEEAINLLQGFGERIMQAAMGEELENEQEE